MNALRQREQAEESVIHVTSLLRTLQTIDDFARRFYDMLPDKHEGKRQVECLLDVLCGTEAMGDTFEKMFASASKLKVLLSATFHDNLSYGRSGNVSGLMMNIEEGSKINSTLLALKAFTRTEGQRYRLTSGFWNRAILYRNLPLPSAHPAFKRYKEGMTNLPQKCDNPRELVRFLTENVSTGIALEPGPQNELQDLDFKLDFYDKAKKSMALIQFDKVEECPPKVGLSPPHRGCVSVYNITNGRFASSFVTDSEQESIRINRPVLPFIVKWFVDIPPTQADYDKREEKMKNNARKALHNQTGKLGDHLSAMLDSLSPAGCLCDFPNFNRMLQAGHQPQKHLAVGGRVQVTGSQARLSAATVLEPGLVGLKLFLSTHPLRGGLSVCIDARNTVVALFIHREKGNDKKKNAGISYRLPNHMPITVEEMLEINNLRKSITLMYAEAAKLCAGIDAPALKDIPESILVHSDKVQATITQWIEAGEPDSLPTIPIEDQEFSWHLILKPHVRPMDFFTSKRINEIFDDQLHTVDAPANLDSDYETESEDEDEEETASMTRVQERFCWFLLIFHIFFLRIPFFYQNFNFVF